ncbi:MAG TPA: UDP-N-acetylmuramate:L-alanyl-gamma-D-glutamyl-meso-diaminopimelate ligase [Arenicellales bacterium]|nr:UDP-N-acetylmuramate:L-alanyl-gamma-D-glutamyl-meso-diaminopimelate ligase [Arenicellales bacterium]
MTHIHIAGVCGTFMGGVAALAKESGYRVSGCDSRIYPPMSDQLEALGIELRDGYLPEHLDELKPDEVIIGNALSRGNPLVERVLNDNLPYRSGPEWLASEILRKRWVLAVAGTHGKTTTSSLLAWILDRAGLEPGFLIGGVPENFGASARLGKGDCFVVEADEYDTAFFDKRSKFVHYRPRTLVLNNLEFDHADIFDDLKAIMRQFHHLVRTVPGNGRLIVNGEDDNLRQVLEMGCWTPVEYFGEAGGNWIAQADDGTAGRFSVTDPAGVRTRYDWRLMAQYNVMNATAALAAARHAGVAPGDAREAIAAFRSVKRRMELVARAGGVAVYDDFAHHPTAVRRTLEALRASGDGRVICILEPRSNTMRMGIDRGALRQALSLADAAYVYQAPEVQWDAHELDSSSVVTVDDTDAIIERVCRHSRPGDRVVIMSNGGFENLTRRLVERLNR